MSVSITEALAPAGYEPASDPGDARWLLGQTDNLSELFEQAEACIELAEAEQKLAEAENDGDADEIAYYKRQLELTRESWRQQFANSTATTAKPSSV